MRRMLVASGQGHLRLFHHSKSHILAAEMDHRRLCRPTQKGRERYRAHQDLSYAKSSDRRKFYHNGDSASKSG